MIEPQSEIYSMLCIIDTKHYITSTISFNMQNAMQTFTDFQIVINEAHIALYGEYTSIKSVIIQGDPNKLSDIVLLLNGHTN